MNFNLIHKEYFKQLFYLAHKITHDPVESEDIASEALIKLWERFDGFEVEREAKRFLYLTVRNASIDALRTKKNLREREYWFVDDLEKEIEFLMYDAQMLAELDRLVKSGCVGLTRSEQRIIGLILNGSLNTKEIASKLGSDIKTIRNQRGRAISKLKALFGK